MSTKALVPMKEESFPRKHLETEFVRSEESPFDTLASAYDAWFEYEGKLAVNSTVTSVLTAPA